MSVQYTNVNFSVSNGQQFLQQIASGFTAIGVTTQMSGNRLIFPQMGNAEFVGSTTALEVQNPYSGRTLLIPSSGSVTLFARKDTSGNPTLVSVTVSGAFTVALLKSGNQFFVADPTGDLFGISSPGAYYYFVQPNIYQSPNFQVGGKILLFPIAVFRGSSGQVLENVFFTSQYITSIGTSINATAQLCNVSGTFYVFGRFAYPSATGQTLNVSAAVRDETTSST